MITPNMSDFARELLAIVEATEPRLRGISAAHAAHRPAPDRWSAKEVLGHLVDSAANNHRRFVEAQLQADLVFSGYEQEQWVRLQHYHDAAWLELITLWAAYNRHLAHVVASIPDEQLLRPRHPHTLDRIAWQTVDRNTPVTLDDLIRDYLEHLQDHLKQIFALVGA